MLKGRVLLLNQSFEVLGTIGMARAIRMTLREVNPVVVHEVVPNEVLTSAGGQIFPKPSVMSLKHYVKVPINVRESSSKRTKVYIRDGYQCQYCGIKASLNGKVDKGHKTITVKELTLDHIFPRSRGGDSSMGNLVTACIKCNQRKDDRTPEEARMPLLTKIHEVKDVGHDKLMICSYLEHRPEWRPYIEHQDGFKEALAMIAN